MPPFHVRQCIDVEKVVIVVGVSGVQDGGQINTYACPATAPTHRVDSRNLFFVAIHSNHRTAGTKTTAVVLVNSMMGIRTPSRIDGQIRRGLA